MKKTLLSMADEIETWSNTVEDPHLVQRMRKAASDMRFAVYKVDPQANKVTITLEDLDRLVSPSKVDIVGHSYGGYYWALTWSGGADTPYEGPYKTKQDAIDAAWNDLEGSR